MEKRFSHRKAGVLLTAAVAALSLTSFGSSQADASLSVDLRVSGVTGGGSASGTKTVNGAVVGTKVTVDVIAVLTGANHTQVTSNDYDSDFNNDTNNDEALQILVGSFNSTGSVKGDVGVPATVTTYKSWGSPPAPQGDPNFLGGQQADWDGDGDLDIGASGTDPTKMWNARAGNLISAVQFGGGGTGLSSGVTDAKSKVINDQTSEIHVGTIQFTVTANGAASNLQFTLRPQTSGGTSALFTQDGSSAASDPFAPGNYLATAPVVINGTSVPEPASLGLLGLASVGLLSRRRKA